MSPYSPDFNPIEKTCGTLKEKLRLYSSYFETIQGLYFYVFN
ncbi:MAG: transposase [Holosporales bacterium]|nr:transposase [Holosporales bacterium]